MTSFSSRHLVTSVAAAFLTWCLLQSNNAHQQYSSKSERSPTINDSNQLHTPHTKTESLNSNKKNESASSLALDKNFHTNEITSKQGLAAPQQHRMDYSNQNKFKVILDYVIPKPRLVVDISISPYALNPTNSNLEFRQVETNEHFAYRPLPNQLSNQNEWIPPTRDLANPKPSFAELKKLRCSTGAVNRWSHKAAISHPAYSESLLVCEYLEFTTVTVAWQTNDLCSDTLTLPSLGRISDTRILTDSPVLQLDKLVLVHHDRAQHLSCQGGQWVVRTTGAQRYL